jgi:hypothetical protein
MTRFVYDDRAACLALVERLVGRIVGVGEEYQGIGVARDDGLIAAVLYTLQTERDIVMTVAALPGRKWLSHEFLRVAFGYPFVQLGLRRVSAFVPSTNRAALLLNRHLGFVAEGIMRGAAEDGDLWVLGMLRHECRWLGEVRGQETQRAAAAA